MWSHIFNNGRIEPVDEGSQLYVRIGEFIAHVPFLVVTNFAVDRIIATMFLDRHVKAILLPQRKEMFHHAPSEALTVVTTRSATAK